MARRTTSQGRQGCGPALPALVLAALPLVAAALARGGRDHARVELQERDRGWSSDEERDRGWSSDEEGHASAAEVARTIADLARRSGDERPVLTVELMNGLGNQLFQVAALLSVALDSRPRVAVALPDIRRVCCNRTTYFDSVLRKLRPLLRSGVPHESPDPPLVAGVLRPPSPPRGRCVVKQVPDADPWDRNCSDASAYDPAWASRLPDRAACGTTRLYGLFQSGAFFGRHLDLVRQAFWDNATAASAARRLEALVPADARGRPVVSVHYRLGDYDPNGWVLGTDYYDGALVEVGKHLGRADPLCLIFSDEPSRAWARSASLTGCQSRVLVPKTVPAAESMYMMALAQVSVLADSSFAYWAGVLGGPRKQLVVAPAMEGDSGHCWSYLRDPPSAPPGAPPSRAEPRWVAVKAAAVSPQELFAEEVVALGPAPDEDGG